MKGVYYNYFGPKDIDEKNLLRYHSQHDTPIQSPLVAHQHQHSITLSPTIVPHAQFRPHAQPHNTKTFSWRPKGYARVLS